MNANPKRATIDAATSIAPIRLSPKRELFAQAVATGKAASVVYKDVYGVSVKQAESNSYRLMENDGVKRRIAQIMADNAAAQSISVQFLTKKLLDTYALAMVEKQASAAAQTLMGIGKLHGLLVDRVQADILVRKPSASPDGPDEMDADEWLSSYAGPTLTIAPPSSSTPSSSSPPPSSKKN